MIYGYGYEPQSPTYAGLTQYNSSSLAIENKTSDAIDILELTPENLKHVRFLESDPFDPKLWFDLFENKDIHDRYCDNATIVLEPGYLWVHEKDKNIIFWTVPWTVLNIPEYTLIHCAHLSEDCDKLFAYSYYGRASFSNKKLTLEKLKIEIQEYLAKYKH